MEKVKYIWLDPTYYPEYQGDKLCLVEFTREIEVDAPCKIEITANARYLLFVNDNYVGRGPASVGGDFLEGKIDGAYYDTYEISDTGRLKIKAIVTSTPTAMTEYNFGFSGFWARVTCDGQTVCQADDCWDAMLLNEWEHIHYVDYIKEAEKPHKAKYTSTLNVEPHTLAHLAETKIEPLDFEPLCASLGETVKRTFYFDKIYSAYPHFTLECADTCTVKLTSSEQGDSGVICDTIVTNKSISHFTPRMRSVGQIEIEIENKGNSPVRLTDLYIDYVRYPVYEIGAFNSSDSLINKIYDLCMHTLQICRQTIHLDSPTHQEPLACTGDYYIQSMIEYLSLADPTLAEWDIRRTSNLLHVQNGRIFHTTYSLIYPWWVKEHYMYTGDTSVIDKKALDLLLDRFDTYVAEDNGLLEYAPDYMFVDWVVADDESDGFLDGGNMMSHGKVAGYSLHHPPKALGQSVLCMFYYNALVNCAELYSVIGEYERACACRTKAEKMKSAINAHLYDSEKGLYVGGLNTPNRVESNQWLPENTSIVYYLKQANVLAVLFGIAPKEIRKSLLTYVTTDLTKLEMQPYFYHFLLNALYNEGVFGECGFDLIRRYESLIQKCDKGLSEAWENMRCDYSHAWGAAPAYALKRALSGYEIVEAGCKKIKLSPCLFDLESAELEITTPYGKIEISLEKGKDVSIKVPKDIEVI